MFQISKSTFGSDIIDAELVSGLFLVIPASHLSKKGHLMKSCCQVMRSNKTVEAYNFDEVCEENFIFLLENL